ncbi:MAG: TIM-barrel domain-containing protein [Phycisphaerae bacterium]
MSTRDNGGVAVSDTKATCGWRSIGPVTAHRREADGLVIECGEARVRITPERAGTIRVRLAPSGVFDRDHSWAVIADETEAPTWRLEEDADFLYIITDDSRVHVQRNPCRVSFHASDGALISADDPGKGMSWNGDEVRCWKRLDEADHFFGLGERGCPLDKRGTVLVNWNHDAAEHEPWTDPLYQSHPFVLVLNRGAAHGLFFDNTFRASFDLGKTSTTAFSFGSQGGALNYYFIPGPTPRQVVARYASLVGATPLPPRWSLGYQQCRWSYASARRVRGIARSLREHRIPCDTIYLDIDYMDGFRCFTWNRRRFASPARLMRDLGRLGFRVVVIVDPGIKVERGYSVYDAGVRGNHFCRDGDGKPYVGKVWPGETVFPDFTRHETRSWWGGLYQGFLKDGVTGFWNDMNEPADFAHPDGTVPMTLRHDNDGAPADHRAAHNTYGMQMARATFEGVRRLRPNERPFVLTRAGYSGVQRYAAVWTGDNFSSWEHLRMSIPMLLNMGLSGITFCGADIGGFRGHPSPELYTRWLQLGVFYPLCRTHTCGEGAQDGKAPEQDPTSFGARFTRLNRRAIELRYRLMPYVYTQMRQAARTGLPLLRPLLLEFPDYPEVHRAEHEFMFGNQLFVAPVVREHAETRRVRLPEGRWYDFADATPRRGGEAFDLPVDLGTIPMFARRGAIIPMRDVVQFVDERPLDELILRIFPGSGRGSFYNDDGISYAYESGEFILEDYEVSEAGAATCFELTRRLGSDAFAPKSYLLQFHGIRKAPRSVTAAGAALPRVKTRRAMSSSRESWSHDEEAEVLSVRLGKLDPGRTVEVAFRSRRKGTAR